MVLSPVSTKCDTPGLDLVLVDLDAASAHVEGDIGHVKRIIGEKFLDDITLVTETNHEVVQSVSE